MDKLVKPDVKELSLCFTGGQRCSAAFKLSNLMHTMSVAVAVVTTNPSLFSISHPFSVIPPLSSASYTLSLSRPSNHPPLSAPLDTVSVKSIMLPTGKASPEDLRRLFSKPGPHIIRNATIPITFVGHDVVEFLLSPIRNPNSLESSFLFSKAVAWCDQFQLDLLLRSAARSGNSYIVSTLLDAGADVNSRDSDGCSAMSMAIRSGSADILELLLDSGYQFHESDERFLRDAAEMGRVDLMEIVCLAWADVSLGSSNPEGRTALHVAAVNGHVEIIDFLVSVGADPDVADNNGWTPLHFAAFDGHADAVACLLSHSVFAKCAVTKEGKTAFALAVDEGHEDLYDMLHLGDLLHRAARVDDVHGIKFCLAEGANVNGRDQNGWTPLHRAAFKGRLESVGLLVSHEAQIDAVDGSGYTPLHRAIEAGHEDVAAYLVGHGARVSLKGFKGVLRHDHLGGFDCDQNHPSIVKHLETRKSLKVGM